MNNESSGRRLRVAHLSTFPPLRCGIASFASDLISSTPSFEHVRYALHYGDPAAADAVEGADVNSAAALADCARRVSSSDCDVVCLQHEFGIWGGADGENIHAFLDNLRKPFLAVLHTTFGPGVRNQTQVDIVTRIIRRSASVVVLTNMARQTTEALFGERVAKLVVVPHGIPDRPYVPPPPTWDVRKRHCTSPFRLVTPGFFREDKGLDVTLRAIRDLLDRGHSISYRIVGEPQHQFAGQARYRSEIEELIRSLKLSANVEVDARYLSAREQVQAIQSAHLGLFAYQDSTHASSGTVPLVMAMGRPVLCTPFEYAKAKESEGPGVFVAGGFDHNAIALGVERLMRLPEYLALARATYDRTRGWTWAVVGRTYGELYRACAAR